MLVRAAASKRLCLWPVSMAIAAAAGKSGAKTQAWMICWRWGVGAYLARKTAVLSAERLMKRADCVCTISGTM